MSTITDDLIAFATCGVPQPASAMMRLSLFDWAACGISGAREADFNSFVAAQHNVGGAAEASVFGAGRMPAPVAALVNGTLSHALDYDDTHFVHIGHPSVAVVPAVLALAERTDADFTALLDAATIGVEASIHVGAWLGRGHYQIGFHQTATAGAFGATFGAARLLGLDSGTTRAALGLCASMASGLKAQFGTMAKPLNAGLAARSGVEAALWAQAGMTAADDGLAGPLGFGATHHGISDTVLLATLGQGSWQITTISHKFHACCHGLHAMLEALQAMNIDAADVRFVDVRTHPRWMTVCNIAQPHTGLAAKFSYAQTAAMTLLGHDTAAIASFNAAVTRDPAVVTLRARVRVAEDARLSETQSEVAITHADNTVSRLRYDLLDPMPFTTRASKLQAKGSALLGEDRAETLWQAIMNDDLAALLDQIVTR